jgi:large subunit ribosomal protein L24
MSETSRFHKKETARKMKIHNGDMVTVISGKDKSVTGKVLTVDHKKGTLVVEGVNLAYKHVKPSQKNPQGGRLHKETPIRASKVMVVCPKTQKPTRIGFRFLDDGSKERFARVSGASLGVISPAKPAYSKK